MICRWGSDNTNNNNNHSTYLENVSEGSKLLLRANSCLILMILQSNHQLCPCIAQRNEVWRNIFIWPVTQS